MTKGLKVLLCIFAVMVLCPFLVFAFPPVTARWTVAALFAVCAALACVLVKRKGLYSMYKRQVLGLMAVISILCVVMFFASGAFLGMGATAFNIFNSFFTHILPLSIVIISMEIIRGISLAQERRSVSVVCFLAGIVVDVLCLSAVTSMNTFHSFVNVVAMFLLPAFTSNLLYHFIAKKYGALPNVAYRLPLALYPYLFGFLPLMEDSLWAFAKLVVPIAVLVFISALYDKKKKYAVQDSPKTKAMAIVAVCVPLLLMTSIVMLISCQFRFCAIVIATESMTGELEKGDVIIYEQYRGQPVESGQVIVFDSNGSTIVHRVADVKNINGKTVYYTKGDANEGLDNGYITSTDIIGTVKVRVPFVGYPTIWLRNVVTYGLRGD